MKIKELQYYPVTLPFRFAFKHSLAKRSYSRNVIIKATVENNCGQLFTGYGEGIPRDYVTGETIESVDSILNNDYLPLILNQDLSSSAELLSYLNNQINYLNEQNKPVGSIWCALETALIDAACNCDGISVLDFFKGNKNKTNSIRYGAVIPFSKRKALVGMLLFYKLYGFSTVKIKVGLDIEKDIENIRLARLIMGENCILRVDANCAWSMADTINFSKLAEKYNIASIEQPLPANNIEELTKLAGSIPQAIVLDESLCTIKQAELFAEQNANRKLNVEFNIRLSKVGGFISASKIRHVANSAGIKCHLGAQVGESGILTVAARIFALSQNPFANYEGAANLFLLRQDLTRENLTYSFGGLGKLPNKGTSPGLGITIDEKNLLLLTSKELNCSIPVSNRL